MTSFAFIGGILPLAVSSGAGAGGQNAIGISVAGGMFAATILAIMFVPLFFVIINRLTRSDKRRSEEHTSELQSLMRISYAVFCLTKKNNIHITTKPSHNQVHTYVTS